MAKNKSHELSALFALRSMLHDMERDFGITDLSPVERDVLLAAHGAACKNDGASISSEEIRNEPLARAIAQATFHRALKSLLAKGLLAKAAGFKARHYVLSSDLLDV